MTTKYDGIAKEYQASKLQPWRTHVERYTLLRLTGDVRGLRTLDLACGEGYYTRLLRRLGADPVVGVDLSHAMIDLAHAQEVAEPLGIRYCVGDARSVDERPRADLVFAAYLLNYARNYAELLAMCEAIARNLTLATIERALKSAGLRDIRWHPPQVSPEGLQQSGEEHWRGFLTRPPIVFLECVK